MSVPLRSPTRPEDSSSQNGFNDWDMGTIGQKAQDCANTAVPHCVDLHWFLESLKNPGNDNTHHIQPSCDLSYIDEYFSGIWLPFSSLVKFEECVYFAFASKHPWTRYLRAFQDHFLYFRDTVGRDCFSEAIFDKIHDDTDLWHLSEGYNVDPPLHQLVWDFTKREFESEFLLSVNRDFGIIEHARFLFDGDAQPLRLPRSITGLPGGYPATPNMKKAEVYDLIFCYSGKLFDAANDHLNRYDSYGY